MAIEEGPWTIWGAKAAIGGAFVALATLIIVAGQAFYLPKRQLKKRREELRNPVDIYFLIPPKAQRLIDYAIQNDLEHWLDELTIPPFSTTVIELRIAPRTTFTTRVLQFGCSDAEGNEDAHPPKPIEVDRVYMKQGLDKIGKPGETPGHSINSRDHYEVREDMYWNAETVIVRGLKIQTGPPGTYNLIVTFFGNEFVAAKELELVLRVDDKPSLNLICINPDHETHRVTQSFTRHAPLADV